MHDLAGPSWLACGGGLFVLVGGGVCVVWVYYLGQRFGA